MEYPKDSLYSICKNIAEKYHKGQKRVTGEDFITHPAAVSDLLPNELFKSIAWVHDIIEDTPCTIEELEGLLQVHCFGHLVVSAVRCLTKKKNEPYLTYLKRVQKDECAVRVKIADLTHNLSTCPDTWKKNRDKWELAKHILEREL